MCACGDLLLESRADRRHRQSVNCRQRRCSSTLAATWSKSISIIGMTSFSFSTWRPPCISSGGVSSWLATSSWRGLVGFSMPFASASVWVCGEEGEGGEGSSSSAAGAGLACGVSKGGHNVKASVFCNVSARSRHFCQCGCYFSPFCVRQLLRFNILTGPRMSKFLSRIV